MEEKDMTPSQEQTPAQEEDQPIKPMWQQTKEKWYDKVPLTVKQLDAIIIGGLVALAITFVIIALDAAGVF